MSTDADRRSVLRTTKVRTALKGDSSWINRNQEMDDKEEKPWIAEVRAGRLNSEPVSGETPEQEPQPPQISDSNKTPKSGYPIRGVSTKTDTKPSGTPTNGYMGTSGSTKKSSDAYKMLAPHTLRSSFEKPEPSDPEVNTEELERRTEEASKVLKGSAGRQRSYVLSAAKKYDSTPENLENSASPPTAFVAKRVVIGDDEDSFLGKPKLNASKPVAQALPGIKDVPPPAPELKLKPEVTPKSKPKPDTTSTLNDDDLLGLGQSTPQKPSDSPPTTDLLTGSSSSLPNTEKTKGSLDLLAVDIIPINTNTDKLSSKTTTTVETTKTVVQTKTDVKSVLTKSETKSSSSLNDGGDLLSFDQSASQKPSDPRPTTDLLTGSSSSLPNTVKTKGSLDLLAVDIIPINTNTDKLSSDNTTTTVQTTKTVVENKTDVKSSSSSEKKSSSADLLAFDDVPISKNGNKTQRTVETTITTVEKTNNSKSSVDPFDPIPIASKSTKSSADLFDPLLSNRSEDQTVSVTFEQKAASDSNRPWSKWAIPTVSVDEAENDEEVEEGEQQDDPQDNVYTFTRVTEYNTVQEPEPDPDSRKNLVYVKSYVNSYEQPSSYASYSSRDYDYITSSTSSYAYSSAPSVEMTACTYCGKLVGKDSKITIEHLNISCHPECFKCGICSKPMGDFIDTMFLHRDTVHCETCYHNVV